MHTTPYPRTSLCRNGVVRGASSFDNYNIPDGFPLPEKAEDPLADAYIENTERYFKSMEEDERSECATPKVPQPSNSKWSDVTPTESFSQSGRYSWGSVESADEEVCINTLGVQYLDSLACSNTCIVRSKYRFVACIHD